MKSILVLSPYYLPGFRAGGPIRSIANLVSEYSSQASFYIVTFNFDYLQPKYKNITPNQWIQVDRASVFYLDFSAFGLIKLFKSLKSLNPSVLYINSFFNPLFSLLPLLLLHILRCFGASLPLIVLAPRGELHIGALSLKSFKKTLFLSFTRAFRLHRICRFQATSPAEARSIQVALPYVNTSSIYICSNIGSMKLSSFCPLFSSSLSLRICTISRICKVKNILFSLSVLSQLDFLVYFDIYGPIDDNSYWMKCQEFISKLPSNIVVNYLGPISSNNVCKCIANYDLFFMPSLSENFGHSILEALSASVPVLTSDQTPWDFMNSARAGWVLSLHDPSKFVNVLREYYARDSVARNIYRKNAYMLAFSHFQSSLKDYDYLFSVT